MNLYIKYCKKCKKAFDINTSQDLCPKCKRKKEVKEHLEDGIKSLREKPINIRQAEHNFFEIAEHLNINLDFAEIELKGGKRR